MMNFDLSLIYRKQRGHPSIFENRSWNRMKILVIEDNESVASMIEMFFLKEGIEGRVCDRWFGRISSLQIR